jgi:hypothetical protein
VRYLQSKKKDERERENENGGKERIPGTLVTVAVGIQIAFYTSDLNSDFFCTGM